MHLTLMDFRYANCCRDIERWKAGTPGTRPLSILLVGDEHDLTVSNALEMLTIGALAIALRGLHELLARDPTVLESDLLHDRDRQTLRTPLSLLPHRPNTKPMADTMPREPARNKEPRKEPTNFVARFRFSGQISNRATFFLPKCGFSGYSIPPNQLFQHFPTPTGGCDVARFQKTAENRNRATFTRHRNVPKRPEACVHSKKTRPRPSNVCFVIKRNIRNIRIP